MSLQSLRKLCLGSGKEAVDPVAQIGKPSKQFCSHPCYASAIPRHWAKPRYVKIFVGHNCPRFSESLLSLPRLYTRSGHHR